MPGRILFLTLDTFSSTGGIQEVCRSLCKVLTELKYNFKVYSLNDDHPDERYVDPSNFKGVKCNKLLFGYYAVFKAFKCDTIVLSHANLLLIAWVVNLLYPKKRIILYAHGIEVWRKMSRWKVKFLQQRVEIWAVSNFTSQDIQRRHHIPVENIKVLNNCLNPFFTSPEKFEKPAMLLRRYGLKPEQPILFTLTRMSDSEKYKGYDIVIDLIPELLKHFPALQYIIGGKADVKERRRIVQHVKRLNLQDHVFLTGYVVEDELADHFLLADCFVLPSKKEGFGIVFIEALASGCNVIAGNKDGSQDALLNGILGTLVDPEDKGELSSALQNVLRNPGTTASARERIQICVDHFSFNRYKKNVNTLLAGSNK